VGELLMVSGIVGCRIKWLIDFWPTWAQSPDGSQLPWRELLPIAFNLDGGGAVLYGGLNLGAFGGWLVCRHHRMRLAVVGDLAAPAVLLAIACGRVGCYFNGCTWGTATTLPWGIAPSPQACTLGCSSTALRSVSNVDHGPGFGMVVASTQRLVGHQQHQDHQRGRHCA
jgi:prolipoprotein diacylglyceryltransferase